MTLLRIFKYVLLISLAITHSHVLAKSASDADERSLRRPNILLIVADDLGFSDLGPFGGEIPTPALDKLAQTGMRLASFYTAPTCSPARSMLFSGVDNHLAGIGTMAEVLDRYPALQNKPGYEGYLSKNVLSMPDVLRRNGYRTYMAGKWHLGENRGHWPVDRGFDKSFALLNAGASHFNNPLQLFPPAGKLSEDKVTYVENDKVVPLQDDFYSSKDFADKLIQYLGEHQSDKPFFAYLPFTAPHDPLHSPKSWSDKFKGDYDGGYDQLQQQRLASLIKHGFFPATIQAAQRMPHVQAWDSLDKETRERESRKMEIYAGMIANMDHQIGRVLALLKDRALYDNTLIVFFSDNGANGNQYERYPRTQPNWLAENFDNAQDNWGNKNSRISLGAGWAHASMTPFRLLKFFTTEGGIRSPMIVSGPGV
ncbi:MAG: sulfatase-like hydrolase/transferase, partial [Pseudomonadales bacterium]|nr:sulfatase-like hydrolase/transferase [Pseudomonadales bacterium]